MRVPDARADAKGYWGDVFAVVLILVVLALAVLSNSCAFVAVGASFVMFIVLVSALL